jgi:hypothetical protein
MNQKPLAMVQNFSPAAKDIPSWALSGGNPYSWPGRKYGVRFTTREERKRGPVKIAIILTNTL